MMSPLRLTFLLLGFLAFSTFLTFRSLVRTHTPGNAATEDLEGSKEGTFQSFFSFRSPSSLFPPSAIISLTDDNSTFFLARPADFGPSLVEDGLSGQLWVGSGFGDESASRRGAVSEAEGELGCSDAPGWGDKERSRIFDANLPQVTGVKGADVANSIGKRNPEQASHDNAVQRLSQSSDIQNVDQDDGTDDYLNPVPGSASNLAKGKVSSSISNGAGFTTQHADIESLQEAAEIAGKVVLLSRGSCGFLEKVKWAQRRGAVAVIVGDNTKGGSLVTMYAKGDTSNVTIPSLFSSRTTAHLLSSLIPPKGSKDGDFGKKIEDRTFLQARSAGESKIDSNTLESLIRREQSSPLLAGDREAEGIGCESPRASGWRHKLGLVRSKSKFDDSRRPPSSGRLRWINEQWDEKPLNRVPNSRTGTPEKLFNGRSSPGSTHKDGFEIGIQDWRDPDLISTSSRIPASSTSFGSATTPVVIKSGTVGKDKPDSSNDESKKFSGGSITPSSGQYDHTGDNSKSSTREHSASEKGPHSSSANYQGTSSDHSDSLECHALPEQIRGQRSWLSKLIFSPSLSSPTGLSRNPGLKAQLRRREQPANPSPNLEFKEKQSGDFPSGHQGLWVTLTPTTVSTTPFFDTVLVLVVSPLVTLTVVYVMLLLRSRIRRRRWRAPKSVVDRLPVRTYHTVTRSSASSSSIHSTSNSSSPTSPLLHSTSPYISSRAVGKSTTNSGDGAQASTGEFSDSKIGRHTSMGDIQRQSKPRTRYYGKQVECVVCLEEYEDGQSKVMSLPCGHEFHADCM